MIRDEKDGDDLEDGREIFSNFIAHFTNSATVGVDCVHETAAADFFEEIFVDGGEFVENAFLETVVDFANTEAVGAAVEESCGTIEEVYADKNGEVEVGFVGVLVGQSFDD